MTKRTTLLCILDGFGLNPRTDGNAIYQANPQTFKRLFEHSPSATLVTSGERVGLPAGQMGNSEVGHLNIGAGRVVEQWLLRISNALKGSFLNNSPAFQNFLNNVANDSTIHVIGLYSDGGVHSHCDHLQLLLERLDKDLRASGKNVSVALHLITDGRDTSPNQALEKIRELETVLQKYPAIYIASVCGRFFAMDRDKRWERVERACKAIALGEAEVAASAAEWINLNYQRNVTDEFMEPACIRATRVTANDSLLFWNFREDRMREIAQALCTDLPIGFERSFVLPEARRVLCFTEYDHSFHLPYLFAPLDISNHLGEVIAAAGLKQLRVAESEKYPHVTYFFNGGIEKEYPGEERHLLPSPRDVKTYDLKPEMSAADVCQTVLDALEARKYDLIVVNFANCDMVGHTGVLEAAVAAVRVVDECLGRIIEKVDQTGAQAIIIADHGNAEQMTNYEDGTPHTAHTTYPVPVIVYGSNIKTVRKEGALCDVAPTVLDIMGLNQPAEMTGRSLRET